MVQQTDSQTKSQKDKTSEESQDENYTRVEWLICKDPVHIGGSDSSSRGNNNPIFRLSDRTPAIPGSSLRGALREHAENSKQCEYPVKYWFGGKDHDISTGHIALGWGWPVWWPVHVLGYGTWWVSCLSWLNRFLQVSGKDLIEDLKSNEIYVTDESLENETVYLRWLKLNNVQKCNPQILLPAPPEVKENRRIIVPDEYINLLVDMGLVRQPRVNLKSQAELDAQESDDDSDNDKNTGVKNLFSVEGLPPGAVFMISWTTRGTVDNIESWPKFLRQEHYLGGLWSIGYGRINIQES
jgi:CRISPR/Cas system CMR subunit Cmr4 (Cas7 group RAMP superfamily)